MSIQKRRKKDSAALFLTEMTLCLLFFSLTCSVCIRFFYAGYKSRHEARDLNHFQELTVTAFEILEGWNGSLADFADSLSSAIDSVPVFESPFSTAVPSDDGGLASAASQAPPVSDGLSLLSPAGCIRLFFDRKWEPCSREEGIWEMQIFLYTGSYEKGAVVSYCRAEEADSCVYRQEVRFPVG